jgi:hypothetical protein
MDASTREDALLRALWQRQQGDLEATIDVEDRLRRLRATVDNRWWDDLVAYRETLVADAGRALTPPIGRGAEYGATAGTIVNEVFAQARFNAPELRRLSPARRRRWLLNRTLERVEHVIRGSAEQTAPGLVERR